MAVEDKEKKDLVNRINDILDRFILNLNRIKNLLSFPKGIDAKIDEKKYRAYLREIYRAMVVLLHASFEDVLREIIRLKLGECSEDVLNAIPIVEPPPNGKRLKFSLGILSRHRGKSIEQLIQESINDFLDRTSFNSCKQIASMLELISIDVSTLRKYFPKLDKMILRRHQIVHKADLIGSLDKLHSATIEPSEITDWALTVGAFITELLGLIHPKMTKDTIFKNLLKRYKRLEKSTPMK